MAGILPTPIRFSCIGGRCVYDPHGQYGDLFTCIRQCGLAPPPPTVTKYSCSGSPDYACVENPNGQYGDLQTCRNNCVAPPPQEIIPQTLCGRDKVIEYDTRRIQTNLWGVPSNEYINLSKNCVLLNSDGTFGWKWDRPDPKPLPGEQYIAPIYPDITTGTSPWGGYNSNPNLPVKVRDIGSLMFSVDYRYSVLPSRSDGLNFAYDMWVLDKPVPDQVSLDTRKEIMIWINKQNVPMPPPIAQVSDGINKYSLDAWEGYNAFMLEVLPSYGSKSHNVNVKVLLDYLVHRGFIPADWYLAEVGLGNEIWKSRGQMQITKLEYMLNGISI